MRLRLCVSSMTRLITARRRYASSAPRPRQSKSRRCFIDLTSARDGAFETIDYPSSVNTGTLVMNNEGLIVGGFIDANGREPGFMAR
jgi:hypothetical protein